MGTFRPLVPKDLHQQVLNHLHDPAHPGMQVSCHLITSSYVWKGLSTEVTAWARPCLHCQQAKIHHHIQVPPQHILVPTCRFNQIHVDLVGPLLASRGFTHLFTIIDRTFPWPEAIPLISTTTVDWAHALFQGLVYRFSNPAVILSDCGAHFNSALWAALCNLLDIQHAQRTAYHPQCDILVERFYRRLKDALWTRCAAAN